MPKAWASGKIASVQQGLREAGQDDRVSGRAAGFAERDTRLPHRNDVLANRLAHGAGEGAQETCQQPDLLDLPLGAVDGKLGIMRCRHV